MWDWPSAPRARGVPLDMTRKDASRHDIFLGKFSARRRSNAHMNDKQLFVVR
jgi:hypothetical protein